MQWTDRRARRTQEMLSGMRIVKLFSYESNFFKLISTLRKHELKYVFFLAVARAGLMATAISLPLLAGVLAVITYYFKNDKLDPEKVFPAITLFQLLRLPLMFLPFGISVIADGANSFIRLRDVFYAEQHDTTLTSDETSPYGLNIDNATFVWEGVEEDDTQTTLSTEPVLRSSLSMVFPAPGLLSSANVYFFGGAFASSVSAASSSASSSSSSFSMPKLYIVV